MLMVNPVVSVLIGALVFDEHLRSGPGFIAAELLSLAVMLAGAYLLSQSPLVAATGPEGELLRHAALPA
jgi:EamA domain-containing membrane protein RarD